MACCLTAPSYYQNQHWCTVKWTPRNYLQWNWNYRTEEFLEENSFENIVCKISAILLMPRCVRSWWRHQMETFSALLAICAGIHRSPVNSPHKASDAELWCFLWSAPEKKRLGKQWWGWWFETPSRPLWRHCNVNNIYCPLIVIGF